MTREQILSLAAADILELAKQLRVGYQLKRTMRYATERDHTKHSESVAEHKFALHYLNYFFLPLEDPERKLDMLRIHRMITFHDFGEIPGGDKPYHIKTPADEARERDDAELVFGSLPHPLADIARESWWEYEQRETLEAKYTYALDKLEPQFELLDSVSEQSLPRLAFTYEHHVTKKYSAMVEFPVMRRFVEVLSADMLKRDVFWRKPSAAE